MSPVQIACYISLLKVDNNISPVKVNSYTSPVEVDSYSSAVKRFHYFPLKVLIIVPW